MAVAPLIKPIQTQKGMFYSFQSAIEDLSLTFNNNTNKFRFSKFALLRIPEIGIPSTMEKDNKMQFLAQGETPILNPLPVDQNINLAQSFQNYALNFESLLISQSSYNREKKLNVSERIFWKWLKELGAVRWRDADTAEVIQTLPVGEKRWAEDWYDPSQTTYDRVVKYIGEIDVVNSVRSKDNSYSELYIHVPTNVGTSPTVLFNSKPDENYGPGMVIVNTPGDPLDAEYLNGRHYNDLHPLDALGMSLRAFYDLDANLATSYISDVLSVTPSATGFWWGASSVNNSYYTDQADYFGTPYGVTVSNPKKQRIAKEYTDGFGTRTVEFIRSTHDGMVIDFNLSDYLIASQDPTIKSFAQLNDNVGNEDFEFNAILVYYDVYDPAVNAVAGIEPVSVTNLYGVYFLNQVVQSGSEFIIPMITKNKPDTINKTNGNSFAFKVNLKFDTSIEDVAVEKSINDYNTFSLNLFTDVLTQIRLLQTKFNDKLLELQQLGDDVNAAKDAMLNSTALSSIANRIAALEITVAASTSAFAEATALMDLIDSLNTKVDNLLMNKTAIALTYQTDLFKEGYGISLDKTVANELKIKSNVQAFSTISEVDFSVNTAGAKTVSLGEGGTQVRHLKLNSSSSPIPFNLTRDITIYVDDSVNSWKSGQALKVVFDSPVVPGAYSITIKTDSQNITNAAFANSVILAKLTAADFPTNYGRTAKPIVDIVCKNSKTLTFVVDKIIR
jgi:hypothetical protein